MKFFKCEHCGNIVAFVKNKGVPVMCCGQNMTELVPNVVDAASEKHVPVIEQNGNSVVVKVGSVAHPMLDNHFIEWIAIQTTEGNQRKELKPNELSQATFMLADGDNLIAAYEYCNLHGLWKITK